jgi:hypothetical protein
VIDFRATALLPEGRGAAEVENKQKVIRIDANMEKLQPVPDSAMRTRLRLAMPLGS